jgi:uncharacterized FlaG/YvyC family protein
MDIAYVQRAAPVSVPSEVVSSPMDSPAQRELIQAVRAVNQSEMFGAENELTFQRDRETRRMVIRLVDRRTNEVVSQLPPEYVLRVAQELSKGA